MALIIQYNSGATPQSVIQYFSDEYVNYNNKTGYLALSDATPALLTSYNNAQSLIAANPVKYLKVVASDVALMTSQEQSAVDADLAAAVTAQIHLDGVNQFNGVASLPVALRAFADQAISEINLLREWIVSFKAATAAATSLSNLQTRVAALSDMPDRTLSQLKTEIQNEINAGTVDSK